MLLLKGAAIHCIPASADFYRGAPPRPDGFASVARAGHSTCAAAAPPSRSNQVTIFRAAGDEPQPPGHQGDGNGVETERRRGRSRRRLQNLCTSEPRTRAPGSCGSAMPPNASPAVTARPQRGSCANRGTRHEPHGRAKPDVDGDANLAARAEPTPTGVIRLDRCEAADRLRREISGYVNSSGWETTRARSEG